MSACPNPTAPEYQQLIRLHGEGRALLAFTLNNYEVPTLDKSVELLKEQPVSTDVVFNRTNSYSEQLHNLKEKWNLIEVTKDGIKGYQVYNKSTGAISQPSEGISKRMAAWVKQLPERYSNLSIRLNKTSGLLEVRPNDDIKGLQHQFSEGVSKSAFTKIADRLAERLGIPYKVINEEQAATILKDAPIQWNGEKSFVYNGTVHVLDTGLNLTNPIHEYSHIFIRAVAKESPYLVQKLLRELKTSTEGRAIIDYVNEKYKDFDADHRNEEMLVRAITQKALGMVDKEGNVTGIVQRIWNNLRNILRNIFGVSVSNLSEHTTMDQLAAILLGEREGEKLDLSKATYFKDLYPLFNRELLGDLERLDTSKVKSSIDNFYEIITKHLSRLMQDRNLTQLKEIFRNDKDSTILKDAKEVVKRAKDFAASMNQDRIALRAFADTIEGAEVMSKRMADHVATFDKTTAYSNQEKLGIFRKYSFLAREWTTVLDQFQKAIADSTLRGTKNPLTDTVNNIRENYNYINDKVSEYYQKDGITKALKDELDNNIYYQAAIGEQKANIERLQKLADEGNKSAALKVAKEKELLRRYELTEDTIGKYLAGEMGDTNYYSMYLESYTSSPDPIVGSFTNWFLKQKYKAQVRAQERLTNFENVVGRLYRRLGYTAGDFQKVAGHITQLDEKFNGLSDDGTVKTRKVYSFLNQYSNNWELKHSTMEAEAEKQKNLALLSGDWNQYRKAKQELEQFEMDHMFSEEGDKVKEARLYWYQSNVNFRAKEERDKLYEQLRANRFSDFSSDEALAKAEENKDILRQLQQLGSLRDENGNMKSDEALHIAEAIKNYRDKYGDLYEFKEIKGMFEANLNAFTEQLVDELLQGGVYASEDQALKSPEFKDKLNRWYRDNHRVNLSEQFYKERQDLLDQVSDIISKIKDERQRKQLDISALWGDIIDSVKGYRDDDGVPIGTDLSDTNVANIKKLQEKINDIRKTFASLNGLTSDESNEYFNLSKLQSQVGKLSGDDYKRYKELEQKSKLGLTPEDKLTLNSLFEQLASLQSKIATNYYTDELNRHLRDNGLDEVDQYSIKYLDATVIEPILEGDPEFKSWYNKNHIEKYLYNKDTKEMEKTYERLYIWNRIVPNDEVFQRMLTANDWEGIVNYKSPYIDVKKSQEYYYRDLKDQYRVKGIDGVTTDNTGNWIPRPTERSATVEQKKYMSEKGLSYAKDSTYENQEYMKLKEGANQTDKDHFELLNEYTKFHLGSQEDLPYYARLGMEVPRLRKNAVETFNTHDLAEKPKEFFGNIGGWIKALIIKRQDDYELGTGNFNAKAASQAYVLTDLLGNQINSIPIKYKSHIEHDEVSKDVGKAVSLYAVSAEVNKMLHEINPMANALQETLANATNKPKETDKKSRGMLKLVGQIFDRNVNKSGNNNRLTTINNFLERELEGIENKMQFGVTGEKVINGLMKIGAVGSLGLNVFAGLKNLLAGQVQNHLEAIMGKSFTQKELALAQGDFSSTATKLVQDYYKIGNKSLETQMFLMFDPMNHYQEKAGTDFSKTLKRDFLSFHWVMQTQKFGELNIQGSAWMAMMRNQRVELLQEDGTKKQIMYKDAWQMKDGVASLIPGVDPKWDRGGENFLQFVAKVHKVNELNQGAYSHESQPEIARMTLGKLALFMRKFMVPGAINRTAPKRFNYAIGDYREGYWQPLIGVFKEIEHIQDKWATYTPTEQRAAVRALSELGYSLMFMGLILLLGFNDNDSDRYKKLLQNDWFHNFMLYELIAVKSESETFIPWYGMGLNEIERLISTPTIAYSTLRKWVKMGYDLQEWVLGQNDAYYKKKSGLYDAGTLKFMADLLNLAGWKSFAQLEDTGNLATGIRAYDQMQRRL